MKIHRVAGRGAHIPNLLSGTSSREKGVPARRRDPDIDHKVKYHEQKSFKQRRFN
jgi:hypothetical protein